MADLPEVKLSALPSATEVLSTDKLYVLTATGSKQAEVGLALAGATAAITPTGAAESISIQQKVEHHIDLRDYIPAGQHNAIYAGTSDYDALADIQAAIDETISVNGSAGPTIQFPYGKLLLSGSIQLKKVVSLIGHSSSADGSQYATVLSWPELTGAAGIYVNRFDTLGEEEVESGGRADGSLLQRLALEGPGGYDETGLHAGIRLRARARLEDVSVSGFAGDGINGQGADGNVNTMWVNRVRSQANGRHGIYMDGGDSNAGTFIGVTCNYNGGYGVCDSSFLGNTWLGGHYAYNGAKGQVSHGGNRYYLYDGTDGIGASTTPGTDDTIWKLIGEGGVHQVYPAWSAENTYIRGGPIMSDGANSRSIFLGHYTEGGQPPSFIRHPAMYIPAMDGAGTTPSSGGLIIRNRIITRATLASTMGVNAILDTYADNAAAISGGLAAGDFYKTSTGAVMVRY